MPAMICRPFMFDLLLMSASYSINTSCELEDKQHLHLKLLDNGDIGTECSTPGSKIDISVRQSPKCVRLEKNELYQLTGT